MSNVAFENLAEALFNFYQKKSPIPQTWAWHKANGIHYPYYDLAEAAIEGLRNLPEEFLLILQDGEVLPKNKRDFNDIRNHFYSPKEFWNVFLDRILNKDSEL